MRPNDNADRFTLFNAAPEMMGGNLRAFSWLLADCAACCASPGCTDCVRGGSRGGRLGFDIAAFAASVAGSAGGVTSPDEDGALHSYFGRSLEYWRGFDALPRTGNGGRSASPHAGALTLLAESLDFVLEAVTRLVAAEYADVPDAVESSEPLRPSTSEGLLEGNAGGGCDGWREGSGGGGGLALEEPLGRARANGGGGSTPFCFGPLG